MSSSSKQHLTLDRKEMAEELRVTPRTLRGLVKAGQVPAPVKIGKRRLIWRVEDLQAFLAGGGTPGFHTKKPGRPRKSGGAK